MDINLYDLKGHRPLYWSEEVDKAWKASLSSCDNKINNVVAKDGDVVVVTINTPIFNGFGIQERLDEGLREAGTNGEIRVDINSPGGNVFDAVEFRTKIAAHKGKVTAQVVGLAASAAQWITMAADEIKMVDSGMLMIHRAQGFFMVYGDMDEARKRFNSFHSALKKVNSSILRDIAKRMKLSSARVDELMEAETYYSADEAVEANLVDVVVELQPSENMDEPESEDEEMMEPDLDEGVIDKAKTFNSSDVTFTLNIDVEENEPTSEADVEFSESEGVEKEDREDSNEDVVESETEEVEEGQTAVDEDAPTGNTLSTNKVLIALREELRNVHNDVR